MSVNGLLLNALDVERNPDRQYRVGTVSTLEDIPRALGSCSPHFILLLAIDASSIEDDRIRKLANALISRGLAGVSVWGPDCSRVHDLFDEARDPEETDERVVVTTWHDNESIEDAVCFFDLCAYPSDDFERDCRDWVAIAVGNKRWEEQICKALNDGFDNAK